MTVSPRPLILNLVLGARGQVLEAREAVTACALFGVPDNTTRVMLARLTASGLLRAVGRGLYGLGPAARTLAEEVAGWRDAPGRLVPWQGDWIAVHTGGLGRSDRPALRQRERALRLLGLAPYGRGLFLRPDNLAGGVALVRERLRRLGLEPEAPVFVARGFEAPDDHAIRTLWDGAALDAGYRAGAEHLDRWLAGAAALPPEIAAREAFRLGDDAIRQVVYDPLLPEPLVDGRARDAFFDAVRRFDAAGHAIWHDYLSSVRVRNAVAPPPKLPETT